MLEQQVRGLVKEHLDSFNYFVTTGIKKIVAANNTIKSGINPTNVYLRSFCFLTHSSFFVLRILLWTVCLLVHITFQNVADMKMFGLADHLA